MSMNSADASLPLDPDGVGLAGALGKELGLEEVRSGSWFSKLVLLYLRRRAAGAPQPRDPSVPLSVQADRLIRRASVKSTLTGAAAGTTSTGAALITLNLGAIGAVVGVPATAGALLGEVLYRAVLHLDLTCALADLHGVRFHADEPWDLMRLYALVFGGDEGPLPGTAGALLDQVVKLGGDDMALRLGTKLIGQALKRSAVPVVGIATSAYQNYQLTRKLGETVLHYVRFQRALLGSLGDGLVALGPDADLLIEGVWFVLTADGQLLPEEAATLDWLLRQRTPTERQAIRQRFTEDDDGWIARLAQSPEGSRDRLLESLVVAASSDGTTSLPERRVLRHAARALGRELDLASVERLAKERDVSR
jgi:hypothetical protein